MERGSPGRIPTCARQVTEVARPVRTIAAPAASTASSTSASRVEPPGWMIAVTPASSASCGPSANGKNASLASTAPVDVVAVLARLLDRDPHGVDAAHLPGADPDRLQVADEHDCVRRDVLAHAPREQQVAPLRLADLAGDDLHRLAILDVAVAFLDEQPAEHALVVALGRASRRDARGRRGCAAPSSTRSASTAPSS